MKNKPMHAYLIEGISSPSCFISIKSALGTMIGVSDVQFDYDRRRVTINYDLRQIDSRKIEEMFTLIGYPVSRSLWQNLRLGWIHYTEQNLRDNLTSAPADCCSNPHLPVRK